MEKLVIGRGVLAGAVGGLFAFLFARIFAEPIIGRAIDYEAARDAAKETIGHGGMHEGPELFSRAVQANVGIGVGIIALGCALGALFAVVYCFAAPRLQTMTPRGLSLAVAMSMFLGIYLLPALKYPANPPAVGNGDTIGDRSGLYLLMVAISVALVLAGWLVAHAVTPKLGSWYAMLSGAAVVLAGSALAMAVLPPSGHLAGNPPGSATETPRPLLDAAGNIVFPGFNADDLYQFRLFSIGAQLILWLVIGLLGGELLQRLTARRGTREPVLAA
ncbi:CbtA family protein [Rhodococcus sp. D2-41]|nr:CbtA family protein [Rhodococcus sp. D2-41]